MHHFIASLAFMFSASYLPPESDDPTAHVRRGPRRAPCHCSVPPAGPSPVDPPSGAGAGVGMGSRGSSSQQSSQARLQSPHSAASEGEPALNGNVSFFNCIKPFPCLESATFFKAAEQGARLQFAFPRSPAFRAPKNNEPLPPPPPAPPLQPAKGGRENKQAPSS